MSTKKISPKVETLFAVFETTSLMVTFASLYFNTLSDFFDGNQDLVL